MRRGTLSFQDATLIVLLGIAVALAVHPPRCQLGATNSRGELLNDPPLGSLVALPNADVYGEPLQQTPSWIVLMGSCSGCTVQTFDPTKLRAKEPILVVLHGQPTKVQLQKYRDLAPNVRLIGDQGGNLHRELNGFFLPRTYKVDEQRRLVWSSQREGDLPDGLQRL